MVRVRTRLCVNFPISQQFRPENAPGGPDVTTSPTPQPPKPQRAPQQLSIGGLASLASPRRNFPSPPIALGALAVLARRERGGRGERTGWSRAWGPPLPFLFLAA